MRNKFYLVLLALVAYAGMAHAQPAKLPRVGLLLPDSGPKPRIEAFQQGLREHGYIEGQNIIVEYRFAQGNEERMSELAAELVGLKVDLIVAAGTQTNTRAKKVAGSIPIVMINASNPVGAGLIASFERAGGTITGLANISSELSGKRLETVKEIIPQLARVAVLYNAGNPGKAVEFKETEAAAGPLAIQLQSLGLPGSGPDLAGAFESAAREKATAVVVLSDFMTSTHSKRIVQLALRNRLPTMFSERSYVDAGGLIAYGPNSPDLFRRAAIYIDKILKGANPAEIPVARSQKFDLVINLQTAKEIGLTIPPDVLNRASAVIGADN